MSVRPSVEQALLPDGRRRTVLEFGDSEFLKVIATEYVGMFDIIETRDLDFTEILEQATRGNAPLSFVIFNEEVIERVELFARLWWLADVVVEAIDPNHCRVRKAGAFDDGGDPNASLARPKGASLN